MRVFTIDSDGIALRLELALNMRSGGVNLKWLTQHEHHITDWYCLANQKTSAGSVDFTSIRKLLQCILFASISNIVPTDAKYLGDDDPFYEPDSQVSFYSCHDGLYILAKPTSVDQLELTILKQGRRGSDQFIMVPFGKKECQYFCLAVIRALNDFYKLHFPEYDQWVVPDEINYELAVRIQCDESLSSSRL